MSNHSLTRIYLKKRRDVGAFHVIVGSVEGESTENERCCGKETCCARGTLLPRILLSVVAVLTFAGQMIYAKLYHTYPVFPNIIFLPFLVGIPIIAFIMAFWVNAFFYCAGATVEPCCCMRTLDDHLRCAHISSAVTICLFLGGLSFSLGGFDIDRTISTVFLGLSIATWIVGGVGVGVYLICQINCSKKSNQVNL